MASFDPATAYSQDWQWMDFIEEVSWERPTGSDPVIRDILQAQFGDESTGDLTSVSGGIAFTGTAVPVVVWEIKPADVDLASWTPVFAPEQGHILRTADGTGWLILTVVASKFNRWELTCQKEVTNA